MQNNFKIDDCQKWDLNPRLLSKTRILFNWDHPASCWLESGALDRSAILTYKIGWLNQSNAENLGVTVQIPNLTGVFCCSKKQSFRLRTLILFQPWRRAFARNNNILHIVPWRLKLRKNLSSPILKISSFWNYPAVIIKNSSSFASLELGVHKLFVYQPIFNILYWSD